MLKMKEIIPKNLVKKAFKGRKHLSFKHKKFEKIRDLWEFGFKTVGKIQCVVNYDYNLIRKIVRRMETNNSIFCRPTGPESKVSPSMLEYIEY